MFCEKKKSKCPKKNFQSVKRGENCLSIEFRVFGKKKELEDSEKRFLGGNFAKFVFTWLGFMLICKFKLQRKKMEIFKVFFEAV